MAPLSGSLTLNERVGALTYTQDNDKNGMCWHRYAIVNNMTFRVPSINIALLSNAQRASAPFDLIVLHITAC